MSKRKEEIEKMGEEILKTSRECGLKVNKKKTIYMQYYLSAETEKNKLKHKVIIDKTEIVEVNKYNHEIRKNKA